MSPAVAVCESSLVPIPIGLHFSIEVNFTFSDCYNLIWPLTLIYDLWPHQQMRVPMLHPWHKFGSNRTSTVELRPILHFQSISQLDCRWPLTLVYDLWPHQQMRVPMLHLWVKFGSNRTSTFQLRSILPLFYIFSLSYNLTSHDLWPWCVTLDLTNKCDLPCCTYDPSLV